MDSFDMVRKVVYGYLGEHPSGYKSMRSDVMKHRVANLRTSLDMLSRGVDHRGIDGAKGRLFFHPSLNHFLRDYCVMHHNVGRRLHVTGLPSSGLSYVSNLLQKATGASKVIHLQDYLKRDELGSHFAYISMEAAVMSSPAGVNLIAEGSIPYSVAKCVWGGFQPDDVFFLIPDRSLYSVMARAKASQSSNEVMQRAYIDLARMTDEELLDACLNEWFTLMSIHADGVYKKVNVHFVKVKQHPESVGLSSREFAGFDW